MSFNYYDSFYGVYIGIKIRGAVGKKYIYQVDHNIQRKRRYFIPIDPKTPAQLKQRDLLRKATYSWQSLSNDVKDYYNSLEPFTPIMSGFNYYISLYIQIYK